MTQHPNLNQFDSEHDRRFLWLTIIVATVLLSVTIVYPFALDHNLYQSMAWQLVRFHQLPELGSWDTNWPGVVLPQALSMILLGNSVTAFRIVDAVMHIGLSVVLYRLLRRWVSPQVAFSCVVVSLAFFMFRNEWNSGERDGYVACFVLIEALLLYQIKDRLTGAKHRRMLLSGLAAVLGMLSSLSILIRPTSGLFSISVFIGLWMLPSKKRTQLFLSFVFGSLLLFGVALLPYALIPNGLRELYLSVVQFNFDVYASAKYRVPYSMVIWSKPELIANVVLVVLLFEMWLRRRGRIEQSLSSPTMGFGKSPDKFDRILFLSYYLSARLTLVVMGKYWRYQYEFVLVITAIVLGLLIESFLLRSKGRALRRYGLLTIATILILLAYPWRTAGFLVAGIIHSDQPLEYARDEFAKYYVKEGIRQRALKDEVLRKTKPKDRIELVDDDPNLYWSSGLQPASRFTSILSIDMQKPAGGYTDYQLRWRKEFIDSLRTAAPRLIIVSDSPGNFSNFLTESPRVLVHKIPGFDSLLSQNYALDTTMFYWAIYRRKW